MIYCGKHSAGILSASNSRTVAKDGVKNGASNHFPSWSGCFPGWCLWTSLALSGLRVCLRASALALVGADCFFPWAPDSGDSAFNGDVSVLLGNGRLFRNQLK